MKICPKCGKENSNNSNYCVVCGNALSETGAHRKDFNRVLLLVAGALAVVFILGGIALFIKSNKSSDASNTVVASEPGQVETIDIESETEIEPEMEIPTESQPASESESKKYKPSSAPANYYFHNGHTYGFYNAAALGLNTYRKVVDFCQSQGGYLAVINDDEENNFLFDLVSDNFINTAFFGYSDEQSEGFWEWANGDSDFHNWTVYGQSQPDDGNGRGEDYAEFNYERGTSSANDGTWNDAQFRKDTDTFICEWDYDMGEVQ